MPIISGGSGSGAVVFPLGVQFAQVLTGETTASATYTALTTPGPAVTVTVRGSGIAVVGFNTQVAAGAGIAFVSVAVSGATTTAASDDWGLGSSAALNTAFGRTYVFTGLAAGSTTFTLQYRSASGTATFLRRTIWAMAQ